MTAAEALEFARTFPEACIIPLHFEGWRHFTESRSEINAAFVDAGLRMLPADGLKSPNGTSAARHAALHSHV